jgi:hypothetical protein
MRSGQYGSSTDALHLVAMCLSMLKCSQASWQGLVFVEIAAETEKQQISLYIYIYILENCRNK